MGEDDWWPVAEWATTGCGSEEPERLPEGRSALALRVRFPFSMSQLNRVLRSQGYRCEFDVQEQLIRGLWNDVAFYFNLSECKQWLGISSNWDLASRYDSEMSDVSLQELCNEWNRRYLQPTAYPSAASSRCRSVTLHYSAFVGAGISDAQLDECVHRALDVSLQGHSQLGYVFPL